MTTKALIQENNTLKNIETIESYLCSDEESRLDIVLTPKQQELLERWTYCEELICKDKFKHGEIVDMLKKKFSLSDSSAWDDLRNTQIVFAASNAINKRHGQYRQIRRLENSIRLNELSGNWKTVENLEKVLQKAYDALPDAQAPKSARTIVFNIQNNNNTFSTSDDELQQAIAAAEEYTDYTPAEEDPE